MIHKYGRRLSVLCSLALILALGTPYLAGMVSAATDDTAPSNFALQITPSPLVTTVKPGQVSQQVLKIHNGGDGTEKLKIEPRSFKFNSDTGQVQLSDDTPPDIASWISFSSPTFTVQPGEWFSETIKLALPKDTGFSYSFALVISRQSVPKATTEGRLIEGSVADFMLVNVDRPGATSNLSLAKLVASKHVYEYLPTDLSIRFKNGGNTIVQPAGNIFISRGANAKTPITTLPVNATDAYILPGTERTLTARWTDGFPVYKTVTAADGTTKTHLAWNWAKFSSLRIGKYTAQLVAVYNDGQRDVPLQGQVSFWVIPWKVLIVLFVIFLLVLAGLWSLIRWVIKIVRRIRGKTARSRRPE